MSGGIRRWFGRVALVTGASTGIGATVCRELVREGMVVVGCARNTQRIEEMAKEVERLSPAVGKLHAIKCDMSVESDIQAMHKEIDSRFGRLDVCINNAVSCVDSSLLMGDSKDWRYMQEVNATGLCINTREALKLMLSRKVDDAQIIHMCSVDGHRIPPLRKLKDDISTPWFHIYFGTKFMTRALAEGLRQELREKGSKIKVSVISPGPVQTESYARTTSAENAQYFFNLYKCLEPEDVADAVKYILSTRPHVNVNDVLVAPVEYNM